MNESTRFRTNLRTVFGSLVSLGVMTAFLLDWIPPASPKELSVGISLVLAWLFIDDWEPQP